MNQNDERWSQEDDPIVQRLHDEKPRPSGFELDRMKMAVMAKMKPSRSFGGGPRSRIAAALLTVGLMAGGTAGTIAATHGSTGGTGAAQAEYKICDHGGPKDRARCRKEHCVKGGLRDRERCICDHGGPADRARCRQGLDGQSSVVVPSKASIVAVAAKPTPEARRVVRAKRHHRPVVARTHPPSALAH